MSTDPEASVCVVGLGSNVGDRRGTLAAGRLRIAALGHVRAASSLWESDPVGGPPQGRFLNAALSLEVRLAPEALLDQLLEIEQSLGRARRERWGPRTLDLDILWWGATRIQLPKLTIPHPRLAERTFALRPLLEVEPDAVDPASGLPYRTLLDALEGPALDPVAGPGEWLVGHALR